MKLKKWMLLGLVVGSCLAPMTTYANTTTSIEQQKAIALYVNGGVVSEGLPVKVGESILVSAIETFQQLGAVITWQENEKKLYVEIDGKLAIMGINDTTLWIDGETRSLDIAPQKVDQRVMISVQVLRELGYEVSYNEVLQKVDINGMNSAQNSGEGLGKSDGLNNVQMPVTLGQLTSMHYEASTNTLTFDEAINSGCIEVEDNYWERKLILRVTGTEAMNLCEGKWTGSLGHLKGVLVEKGSKGVKITISTDTVCAAKIEDVEGKACIQLVKPREMYSRIIVIDPGHGGDDNGTSYQSIYEKNLTLTYGKELYNRLEQDPSIKVYITRAEDKYATAETGGVGLQYPTKEMRVNLANEIAPDLYISVHVNYWKVRTTSGTETHYYPDAKDTRSKQFASLVQKALIKEFGTKDRGLKDGSGLMVINSTNAPAILIETGFISNDGDRKMLIASDYAGRFANAIYECIIKYYEQIGK